MTTPTPSPVRSAELTLDQLVALDSILAKWDINQHGLRQELRDNLALEKEKSRQEGAEDERFNANRLIKAIENVFRNAESGATPLNIAARIMLEIGKYEESQVLLTPPEATSKESA